MTRKIYLHWTAGGYNQTFRSYHSCVTGDGKIHRTKDYNVDLNGHTYARNSNSIGISCACMGGRPDPWTVPPTDEQVEAMCKEVARIAKNWGWTEADITVKNVMTHAEAASNRDGLTPHINYGPVPWGGNGTKWDFMQLHKGGDDNGGDILREKILGYFQGTTPVANTSLNFVDESTINADRSSLSVLIDQNGISWAKATDLMSIYDLSFVWDSVTRRILIGNTDVVPSYIDDQVQADVGHPLFEMCLQGGESPVILVGIILNGTAYCRVLEFAQEFGIDATFQPFSLGSRLGG